MLCVQPGGAEPADDAGDGARHTPVLHNAPVQQWRRAAAAVPVGLPAPLPLPQRPPEGGHQARAPSLPCFFLMRCQVVAAVLEPCYLLIDVGSTEVCSIGASCLSARGAGRCSCCLVTAHKACPSMPLLCMMHGKCTCYYHAKC